MIFEIVKVSPTTEYEVKLDRGLNIAEFDILSNNEAAAIDHIRSRSSDVDRREQIIAATRADQIRILIGLIQSIRLVQDDAPWIDIKTVDDIPDVRIIVALQSVLLVPKVSSR